MNAEDNEQTELLRNIWNQIKALDQNLGRRIDKTNEEVAGVKQEVAGVKQEVAGVKQEVASLKQEVTHLRTDVDGLKVELIGLRGDVDGLRGDVDELKVEVKGIRVATQSGFELLARADTRRDRDVDDLRSRIERVEQHVGLRP